MNTCINGQDYCTYTLIPIQSVAQMVYDLVTPVPGEGHSSSSGVHQRRAPHQPQDFREGVSNAYDVVTEVSACSKLLNVCDTVYIACANSIIALSFPPSLPPSFPPTLSHYNWPGFFFIGSDWYCSGPVHGGQPGARGERSDRGGGRDPQTDPRDCSEARHLVLRGNATRTGRSKKPICSRRTERG